MSQPAAKGAQPATLDIEHIAKLARLALGEDEKQHLASQLAGVVSHFDELNAINVDGVEPSAHAFPIFNVLREDTPGPLLDPEALARIAPAFRDGQVAVPRVVDDEG
ncbi:MAG: Asp-tRNA(Asn)/Glu-tRNA(Gln) amidotransferase subunit GatC [Puniceicoccales bacterium]|jgi:aspartyl-tRNA(Asn)/glutamyl-tRNA(Gln) amidotransferase subunit C|nr:Asp-tRNA(Asn)/Glu-tRNA(Gln) amidotransferase subunit GatC [Puniceicoccales bacterium]